MAYIIQKEGLNLDGVERSAGTVIPEELEDTVHVKMLRRGDVIKLPDSMIPDEELESDIQLSENDDDQPSIDLSNTVADVKEAVKSITSMDYIEQLMTEEAKGKDRKMVYDALQRRKNELRD